MIHLIIGRQGSGKTLFLVKEAYEKYKQGYTVYSNVALKFPYKPLDYNEIIDCSLENAIVIIDEIHLLLSARNSMSLVNREICDSFLSMVRKKGLEVYGSTQTERKVDVRFREEKDLIYFCDKFAYINKQWQRVIHNQNLIKNIPIMIKLTVKDTFSGDIRDANFMGNPFYKLYDTKQIIKVKGLDKAIMDKRKGKKKEK